MDTLQKEINHLTSKMDLMCHLLEQLGTRITDMATECKLGAENAPTSTASATSMRSPYPTYSSLNAVTEHKDVLVDSDGLDATIQSTERPFSPEIQIQRLTAQLTAAYSRIAALEERLLSQRIH